MTTINDINDFIRILRENPEWKRAVQAEIAGEELLSVPQQLAEFIQFTKENFRLVNERLSRLETDVAELKTDVAELKTDMSEVKTDVAELKTDMAEVKTDVAELKTDMAEVKTDVAELKTDIADIKTEQQTMKSQMGNLLGEKYERQIGSMIKTVAQLLGTRNPKILKNIRIEMDQDFQQVIDAAEIRGAITETQANDIPPTDLIFNATRRDNGETIYPVIEISVTLDTNDIERARRRADSIAAVGMPTVAAVIGESISDPARQKAEAENVQILLLTAE